MQADAKTGSSSGTGSVDSILNGRLFGAFVICGDAASEQRDVPARGTVHASTSFVRINTFQCFTFSHWRSGTYLI